MPNPLSRNDGSLPEGVVRVTESVLTCERCFEEVSDGLYYEEKEVLTFKCSNGHFNKVEISL